ncbi:MAG: ThuA domain-containing protein [Chloroflexota bacterium]
MKSALFIWGGWEGHQPQKTAELFAGILQNEGYTVEVSASLDSLLDSAKMDSLDLIVPDMSVATITGDQERALLAAIKRGVGLGGWHGGMGDSFRNNTDYQYAVGGQWVQHPGNAVDYRVNIINHTDPITAGLSDFNVHSEQYYMHTDPGNEVLATTTFTGAVDPWIAGTVMPVVWKRHYGAGKVSYCSVGHNLTDFDIPEVREIIRRGLIWATR